MADPVQPADVNPYAPPSVLDPLAAPDPGVGVWRDGHLLVIHRHASLPPICVKSGWPATQWVELQVEWFDWRALSRSEFTLRVPLADRAAWVRRNGPRISLGICAVAFAVLLLLVAIAPLRLLPYQSLLFVDVLVGLIALLSALGYAQLISCCRVKFDYLWFSGAERRFLAQLPQWPGGA